MSNVTQVLTLTSFGERLLIARERRGLQAKVVAEAIGTSHTTVRNWEKGRGRPAPEQLAPLAAILGVPRDWLLDGEDKEVIAERIAPPPPIRIGGTRPTRRYSPAKSGPGKRRDVVGRPGAHLFRPALGAA